MKVTIDIPEKTLLRIKSAVRHDRYKSDEQYILEGIRIILEASEDDILLKPGRRKVHNACLLNDAQRHDLHVQGYIYLGEHHERLGFIEKESA